MSGVKTITDDILIWGRDEADKQPSLRANVGTFKEERTEAQPK